MRTFLAPLAYALLLASLFASVAGFAATLPSYRILGVGKLSAKQIQRRSARYHKRCLSGTTGPLSFHQNKNR